MIVPDVNLLIYAHNDRASQHREALTWWEGCLNGETPIGLSWMAIGGFLRLMTHARVLANPMRIETATTLVRAWLVQPPVMILQPRENFPKFYLRYLDELGTGGNLTTDAHLAALAMEHQAELHSNDSDFSRFSGLRWKNPLR